MIEAIETYLAMRDDDDPHLFITHKGTPRGLSHGGIASAMKALFHEAGIYSTAHPLHALRHTCATLNLNTGGLLEGTRRLLRHASGETTMIYLRGISRWDDDSERKVAELIFGHGQE